MFTHFLKKPTSLLYVLLCLLLLLAAPNIVAQPGETRSFEEIEKQLKENLVYVNESFKQNSGCAEFYTNRGNIYYQLYENKVKRKWQHDKTYAQNGLADFTKALNCGDKSYILKAGILQSRGLFYQTIWEYQIYFIPKEFIKARLKPIFSSKEFKNAVSDYSKAKAFESLRAIYKFRCNMFLYSPELLKEIRAQDKTEEMWKDFDLALKYAEFAYDKRYSKWESADILSKKGRVAFEAENYRVALDAYSSDEKYLGKDYKNLCGELKESDCIYEKRVIPYRFRFGRARVYVKIGKPEEALSELRIVFGLYQGNCPEPLETRAQAYRQLGKIELALADEMKLQELPSPNYGACDY
jgi:hypothetical protein